MKSLDQTFAEYLTEVRQELTYAACAQKLDIAEFTLHRLTNGGHSATLAMVDHITNALGERASLSFDNGESSGSLALPKRVSKLNLTSTQDTSGPGSSSAGQGTAEIHRRADSEIASLRQQAASELVRRLKVVKQEIKTLEAQYAQLTGKPFPVESSSNRSEDAKPARKRLPPEEKAALVETVREILATNPNGTAIGELVWNTGESVGRYVRHCPRCRRKFPSRKLGRGIF